jgi:hypothetical protein
MKKGGSVVPMGLLRMALVAILVLACMLKMLVPKDKGERGGEGEGMAEGEGVVKGEDVVKIDVMLHGVRLLLRHGFMIHASLTIRTCKKKFSNLPQLYRTITMISCNSLVPSQDLLLVLNPKIRPSLRLDIILFLIWLRLVEPTFSNQKIL